MGIEENNMETVEEIREEATQLVETEEAESSNGGFKQAVGVAGLAAVMIGAGYGLYRLGKVAVHKAKNAYENHKEKIAAQDELDDFDDEVVEVEKKK